MAQEEKIAIDYNHLTEYLITPQNQVGTDADHQIAYPGKASKRTVPTPTGDIAYVRKFGTDYLIKQVTDITDPVDGNMTFTVKAADGTVLGSRVGGGAFSAGSTLATAQACYMEISASGGAVTVLAAITIDTDIDVGGLAFTCAAESVADTTTLTLYLSDTGSTYYENLYRYGGARHTPALATIRKPYFDPTTAYAALNSANDGVEILDSQTYEVDNLTLDRATTYLYSTSGQSPMFTNGVGSRITREIEHDGNNSDTTYVSKLTGNDSTGTGTYHNPYKTIQVGITNKGTNSYLNIMDSETYSETGVINIFDLTIEPLYGLTPTILSDSTTYMFEMKAVAGVSTAVISGLIIDGQNIPAYAIYGQQGAVHIGSAKVLSCSITRAKNRGVWMNTIQDLDFKNNYIYNNAGIGAYIDDRDGIWNIENNVFAYNVTGLSLMDGDAATTFNVINNIAHNNSNYGFTRSGALVATDFQQNTAFSNFIGISVTTQDVRNCISYYNTSDDLDLDGGAVDTYTCASDAAGVGSVTSIPKFCDKNNAPFKLGISADSPCYRTGSDSDDMGARLRLITIAANNIEINGIKLNGQDFYHNGIAIVDTDNDTDAIIKWNSVYDFHGISIDLYDNDIDLDAIISNNIIQNSGNGLRLAYGGNTIEENIFFNNSIFAIWSDYTVNVFNHNVFFGNQYGIHLENNSSGITIKNCIFSQNSLYGIYSEVSIAITYCCIIESAVNSNVNITATNNLTDNPLFVNTNDGEENFTLKRKARGNIVESFCINASDTSAFPDIGAYNELVTILEDSWKKYTAKYNPTNMNENSNQKNVKSTTDIFGNILSYMDDNKIQLPFEWASGSGSTKEQRLKIKHFQNLIPSTKNKLTEKECEFRVHLVPETFFGTGTGTIDTSLKTLTNTGAGWVEQEKKGWHVSIKFKTGTGATVSASGKTLTKVGDFASENWTGFYLFISGHYFYIKSNTDDVLTLSDPNGYLTDKTAYAYTLVKYFKVDSNTETVLTLIDDDSELITGSKDYFFDFILSKVIPANFQPKQSYFDFLNDNNKNDYGITFQEVD